jgi:hypothetical protein
MNHRKHVLTGCPLFPASRAPFPRTRMALLLHSQDDDRNAYINKMTSNTQSIAIWYFDCKNPMQWTVHALEETPKQSDTMRVEYEIGTRGCASSTGYPKLRIAPGTETHASFFSFTTSGTTQVSSMSHQPNPNSLQTHTRDASAASLG